MLITTTVIVLHAAFAAGSPARAKVPAEVSAAGLLDLTKQGEVALLPAHESSPFNALVMTKSKDSCAGVARDMMDVESWPSHWDIKDVHVDERTPTSVRYSMQLDIALVPRIPGFIEHPSADKVIFNDIETGAQFIWTLTDTAGGCSMQYSLLETPGKASGWVSAVKTLEPSAVDAANFAAALSSARGFAKAEAAPSTTSSAGDAAFAALAAHGTALRLVRPAGAAKNAPGHIPVVVARRVIERSVDEVLWSIRDKQRYKEKIEVISKVKDGGKTCRYSVGAFGGRVSWDTTVVESGDAHTEAGLTITETVSGGDFSKGRWTWLVRPVPGGSDVTLTFDADLTTGSTVMTALASTDEVARESMAIHMALSMMGELIGGKPIGQRTLARVP